MKTNTSKDKSDQIKKNNVPEGLKISSIFSMIGSVFFGLISLVLALITIGKGATGMILAVVYICFVSTFIFKFIGALRMYKGKKSGYIMYMIPSVILISIFGFSVVTGFQSNQPGVAIFITVSMIFFLIIFHTYKKQLK